MDVPASERAPILMPARQLVAGGCQKSLRFSLDGGFQVLKCRWTEVTLGTPVCYGLLRTRNARAALLPFQFRACFLSRQTEAIQVYSELRSPALRNSVLVGR